MFVTRSGVILMSEMTSVALIICAVLSVGASFWGWLLAGSWAVLNRALLVTVSRPGCLSCPSSVKLGLLPSWLEVLAWMRNLIQSKDISSQAW